MGLEVIGFKVQCSDLGVNETTLEVTEGGRKQWIPKSDLRNYTMSVCGSSLRDSMLTRDVDDVHSVQMNHGVEKIEPLHIYTMSYGDLPDPYRDEEWPERTAEMRKGLLMKRRPRTPETILIDNERYQMLRLCHSPNLHDGPTTHLIPTIQSDHLEHTQRRLPRWWLTVLDEESCQLCPQLRDIMKSIHIPHRFSIADAVQVEATAIFFTLRSELEFSSVIRETQGGSRSPLNQASTVHEYYQWRRKQLARVESKASHRTFGSWNDTFLQQIDELEWFWCPLNSASMRKYMPYSVQLYIVKGLQDFRKSDDSKLEDVEGTEKVETDHQSNDLSSLLCSAYGDSSSDDNDTEVTVKHQTMASRWDVGPSDVPDLCWKPPTSNLLLSSNLSNGIRLVACEIIRKVRDVS
eukprot:GHVH01002605.1.p1 GENE.GHVH01002605.1~~GHVH01002605.1.p1  ORF type:complete len:407 (+),score=59.95 GHVH01002605.1:187-1407(+)